MGRGEGVYGRGGGVYGRGGGVYGRGGGVYGRGGDTTKLICFSPSPDSIDKEGRRQNPLHHNAWGKS